MVGDSSKMSEFNNSINVFLNDFEIKVELCDVIYRNKENKITIIEIIEDKENDINFLEIDEELYKDESEMYYSNEWVFIIQYINQVDVLLSFGIINIIINN